jgi:integrase
MALTNKEIDAFKPAEAPKKYADGEGMYILVQPNGSKLWQMTYRASEISEKTGLRKQKVISFGAYDSRGGEHGTSLTEARAKRAEVKAKLVQGIDPMGVAAKQKIAEAVGDKRTFSVCAAEWLATAKASGEKEKTISGKAHRIGLLNVGFGDMPVGKITRKEVIAFMRGYEASGQIETMNRLRSMGEQIYEAATDQDDEEGAGKNPFRPFLKGIFAKKIVTHRPALVTDEGASRLFRAMAVDHGDNGKMSEVVTLALRFLGLTAVRPGELAGAEWSEIDLAKARWTIPASRMKMGKEHVVPLSRQALAILRRLLEIRGDGKHVFSRADDKPISTHSLNDRLQQIGFDTETEHTAHGFRSTFSSLMNGATDAGHRRLWDAEQIELQLAHVEGGTVAIYKRLGALAHIHGRAIMMQGWADMIDALIAGEPMPMAA